MLFRSMPYNFAPCRISRYLPLAVFHTFCTIYSIAIRYRGDGEIPKNDIASRLFEMVQYIRLQGVSRVSSSMLDISGKDRRGVSCSVDENTSLENLKKCLDNISTLPKEDLIW